MYTSGTTGKPKGVLHTMRSIDAQVSTLQSAWQWSAKDRILHSLPLHHIHGIVNALYCPLASGATVEMMPKFSPTHVWERFARQHNPITLFMGVPTMYSFLLSHLNSSDVSPATKKRYIQAARRLRVCISGSAACPLPLMHAWKEAVTGEFLLERYGMTETGMVLGNPLLDAQARMPGTVGQPFPGVECEVGSDGELRVRGPQLFAGYWGKPEATRQAFDADGFFLTGDTVEVVREGVEGRDSFFKILGRTSVDIIKSGGFKLSALEIENVLLEHPGIKECAVVGVPDAHYGEIVGVVVGGGRDNKVLQLGDVQKWAKGKLAPYQIPRVLKVLPGGLPRNAMGKVNKKDLRTRAFPDAFPSSLQQV